MSIHELSEMSDADLIRHAQRGTANAFFVFHKRKNDKVLKEVDKVLHDVDLDKDAVQVTWIKVSDFLQSHPDEEILLIDNWIIRIAHNCAIDMRPPEDRIPIDALRVEVKDNSFDE